MIERRGCFGFQNKTIQLFRVLAELVGQKFDGDPTIEFRVLGQIHLTHATCDLGDDAIVRETAGGQFCHLDLLGLFYNRATVESKYTHLNLAHLAQTWANDCFQKLLKTILTNN